MAEQHRNEWTTEQRRRLAARLPEAQQATIGALGLLNHWLRADDGLPDHAGRCNDLDAIPLGGDACAGLAALAKRVSTEIEVLADELGDASGGFTLSASLWSAWTLADGIAQLLSACGRADDDRSLEVPAGLAVRFLFERLESLVACAPEFPGQEPATDLRQAA